jgi:hypothetical protein
MIPSDFVGETRTDSSLTLSALRFEFLPGRFFFLPVLAHKGIARKPYLYPSHQTE